MPVPVVGGHAGLGDVRIYYEIYGQGPPVLLLHGNGENLHVFDDMIPVLTRKYRVIALDTRAHGKSGRGGEPLCFATFARDVAGVMEQMGLARAPLIGFSDGGNTALHIALEFPEMVAGFVLLGANLHTKGIEPRCQIPVQLGYYLCSAIARLNKRAVDKRDILGLMVKHPNLTPDQLAAITAPALVIAGERDIVKRDHTEQIAAAIHGAGLRIIPRENHFGIVKSPRAFRLIMEFLDSLSPWHSTVA